MLFIILCVIVFILFTYDVLYIIRSGDSFWLYNRYIDISKNIENLPAIFYYAK